MARIVAGIGSSHAPSMGAAYDAGKRDDPAWKPLFDGYAPAREWLKRNPVDVAVVLYNDHGSAFFFDRYPTFAIGAADAYEPADEGWGRRKLPAVRGDADLSWHLIESLVGDEFDLTVCQDMAVDHGLLVPLPYLWSHDPDWEIAVVPLQINVLLHPLPTALRCFKLGQAIRRAVASYPKEVRVAVVGTGGLSHQLHGERFGYLNPDWDNEFLDRIESDPHGLARLGHGEYMKRGGAESVEMIMWLAMRGAMSERVRLVHRHYYLPMLTGFGLIVLEDAA